MWTAGRKRATGEPEPWLGMLNGALIGLALALGVWGLGFFAGGGTLAPSWHLNSFLGLIGVVLLAGLAGWLAAIAGQAFISLLIWLGAGVAITWVIGRLAYEGGTLVAWLLDRRFWGLTIYPYIPAALARQVMAGFFVVLLLAILGLLQPYRLEGISAALTSARRLSGHAWLLLLLPLPFVLGSGLIADNLVNQSLRRSLGVVHQVFRDGRTYEGDLFQLSVERGINYNAISAVRQQMSRKYTLSIGEIDLGVAATVFVVAHFDNGAWLNCRVVAEQLSFCWDASPPYQRGLPALLVGQETPDCPECTVVVDAAAQASLDANRIPFHELPKVQRLGQQGSYVWVRVAAQDGAAAVDCLLQGITPVRLVECRAASTAAGSAAASMSRRPDVSRSDAPRGKQAEAPAPTHQGRSLGAQERAGARPGRIPGLMALAPPEPEAPMGMATPDRMAPPPTVDPPAQADLGAQVYWFKCMVCHGDRGQGLTEEWRSAWDPSHRDCWQSRCHASNHPPEGFDFPYGAPPLIGSGTLARHATLADLYTYLAAQMPWQAPGSLPGEEYWQLAAYLARANGVLVSDSDLSPEAAARVLLRSGEVVALAPARPSGASWLFLAGAALLLALLALLYARRKRHRGPV